MSTTRLARHDPSLRPDERLALMLAAAARGDEAEHERLTAAAPRVSFTTRHTFPRAIAYREVLDRFRAERLDMAAWYYHARFAAATARGRERELMVGVALTYGYLLLAHRDGWARFCDEHLLPSGGLDEHLVGGEVLDGVEGDAEADGAVGADVEAFFRRAGEEPPGPLRTAASVAAELTAAFAARLAWWEGEGRGARAGRLQRLRRAVATRSWVSLSRSWPCRSATAWPTISRSGSTPTPMGVWQQ